MKLKEQLESFLQALQADDPSDFLQRVHDHVGHKEGHDLEELLQAVQRKDVVAICLGLKHQVEVGIQLFSSEEVEGDGQGEVDEGKRELGAEVLHSAAVVAKLLLGQNKEAPPEALQQAAELLHDHAILAAVGFPGLQDEVAKLCLEWWQAEAAGRENLTPQAVPYFLMKALTTGTAADVKRCHAMRTALQLFDFDDPSIADVKMLLLRAAFAPSFLRCAEGRRMVAHMFTLQPAFVVELTAIIKNQIPSGRKSVLDAYGEVIYRAWSSCTGACLLHVQQSCIQALMEAAILASTPAMAASIRRVLNGLHAQKHQPGVDKMLLELYEPILFRRLNAANPDVRRNALHVLVDAFPLRDPDESNQDTDKRLSDQFAHLTRLLKDGVPEVRVAAIHGVSRVLNEFWELIPGNVTAGYIKLMAGELAFDAASPTVRAAVAGGLSTLVDNALAHPLLKVVLPQLEPLLFDSATKVRTAMADLLLSLRGIETLPFYTVVPLEKLLDILALDTAPVSERIQRLLLPTFFPNPDTGPAMVAALLRKSPAAGRAFCQFLLGTFQPEGGEAVVTAAGPPLHESQIVGLIKDLNTHLLDVPISTGGTSSGAGTAAGEAGGSGNGDGSRAGKKGRSKRKKAQPAQQQADAEAGQDEETEQEVTETPESWEAILHGACALVCGLAALVAAGRCEEDVAHNLFLSGTLVKLLERCPTQAARRAVMAMAAAFPALDASAEVRGRCLKNLLAGDFTASATSSGGGQAQELRGAVECICAGASTDRLLRVLVASLHGDPAEVLGAACQALPAVAAPVPADNEPVGQGRGSRCRKQCGTKAAVAAAAKPAARKKGKKTAVAEEDDGEEAGVVDESLACEQCGSRARGDEMLLCDNCDAPYHMGCLDPPLTDVPKGDWFCRECDTMMSNGMGKDLAIRCLSLLMEIEEQREVLIHSGALARLLPYLEVALQDRVHALKQALANCSAVTQGEGEAAAGMAMAVYIKGCLHLFLAGRALGKGPGAAPLAGVTSASLMSQAVECTQQAMEWASTLVQQLARLDAAAILQAVGTRPAPEAKRSKVSKKKAAAPAGQPAAAAAVKEAFTAAQACVLMLAEGARVQALTWAAPPVPSLAQAACALAGQFLGVVGGMASAAGAEPGSSSEAADADDVLLAALGNVASLARNMAMAARLGSSTTRDLDTALQQAQQAEQQQPSGSGSEQGSLVAGLPGLQAVPPAAGAAGAVEELVRDLLKLGCQDRTSTQVVAALKPGMAGLLVALCDAASGRRVAAMGGGAWLRPVAELLGRGIDLEDVPAVASEPAAAAPAQLAAEGDENAGAAANQQAGQQEGQQADKSAGVAPDLAGFASEHAEHALVKQLLAAAKLAKVQEQLAGCAAALGRSVFEEQAVRCTLGSVELATLLGFKGVTSRGKSRAGADTYASAIQQLRLLKQGMNDTPAAELGGGTAMALLHHRLHALFPPAPRVTFGAA